MSTFGNVNEFWKRDGGVFGEREGGGGGVVSVCAMNPPGTAGGDAAGRGPVTRVVVGVVVRVCVGGAPAA